MHYLVLFGSLHSTPLYKKQAKPYIHYCSNVNGFIDIFDPEHARVVSYERTSLCCKLRIGKAVPNLGVHINLLNSFFLVFQSFSLDFCTAVLLTFSESGVLKEENGPERSEDTDFDP